MNIATRTRVVHLRKMGYSLKKIRDRLLEENIKVSKMSISLLLSKYHSTGSVADKLPLSKRQGKLSEDHYKWIDEMMLENDELSALKLQIMFNQKWPDVKASVSMIKRARLKLGWVAKKTRYCALISASNEEKRLKWCEEQLKHGDLEFPNVM